MKRHLKLLAGCAFAAPACLAATAHAETVDIGEVVVTANRTPNEKAKVGSKVEVVDKKTIMEESKPLITDYLTLIPGVNVASPGGMGQEGSLSVRGADKKYVKTLFNGIDISDPTSTQVQTPYQNLLTGGVTDIELLKGSQSTLYGADAVAGVLDISTLDGIAPGIHQEVSGEGGSYGTWRGGYTLTGASDTGKAALGLHGLTTNGFSAARVNGSAAVDSDPYRLENDPYRNVTATFAGQQQLSDNFSVFGSGLYINASGDFDDSGNPPTDNTYNHFKTKQIAGRAGFNLDFLDGRLKNTVSFQASNIDRTLDLVSAYGPYDVNYKGIRTKLDYQGSFEATRQITFQYGTDYETQSAHSADSYGSNDRSDMSITGVWGQVDFAPIDNLALTAGLRHDEHSVFGGYTTYRVTGSYRLPDTGTRFHSSFGTGFRAPSLYELFDPYSGNTALRPEQSRSFDAGVEQTFLDGRLRGDVTYFVLNTEDLIDYDYATSRYVQFPGLTRRNGVETSLTWSATEWLDLGAAYTYTHTRQPDGLPRPRIPEHDIALTATARPAERWEISGTAHAVLDVVDRISPSYGTFVDVPLKDYLLLDAKIAYKPTNHTEFYVRGANLLNQKYETVKGYGTPGLSVFTGFRATF